MWVEVRERFTVAMSDGSAAWTGGQRFEIEPELCEVAIEAGWVFQVDGPHPDRTGWLPVRALVAMTVDGDKYDAGDVFDMNPEEIQARGDELEVIE